MSHFVKPILFSFRAPLHRTVSSRLFLQFSPRSNLSALEILPFQALTSIVFPLHRPSFVVLLPFALSVYLSTLLFSLIFPLRRLLPNFVSPNTREPNSIEETMFESNQILSVFQIPDSSACILLAHVKCARPILISRVSLERALHVTHTKNQI